MPGQPLGFSFLVGAFMRWPVAGRRLILFLLIFGVPAYIYWPNAAVSLAALTYAQ